MYQTSGSASQPPAEPASRPPAEPASERTAAALFPGERSALPRSASSARREGSAHSGPALARRQSAPRGLRGALLALLLC